MKLGPYEVLGELGRGGMGVVLRARAPDGHEVAVKLLARALSEPATRRFQREGRLQEGLGAVEGFVPVLDSGVAEGAQGRPYLVMPLLTGGTLRARLLGEPMPVAEAVELARELAGAIGRAHDAGVVHRDLKPENVLFDGEGRLLVADLGLAKHFRLDTPGASQSVVLSHTGEVRGTVGYMPPEQLSDAKAVGTRADVFALGAILYECVAGQPAISGHTLVELLARAAHATHTPLADASPSAPAWLCAVVERALAEDPAQRFADGAAFAQALEAPAPVNRRRRLAGIVGALAAVGLLAGGAASLLAKGDSPAPPLRQVTPAPAPQPTQAEPVVAPKQSDSQATRASPDDVPHSRLMRVRTVMGTNRLKHGWGIAEIRALRSGEVITAGGDGVVVVRDAQGRQVRAWRTGFDLESLALSPDETELLAGDWSGNVTRWEVASGKKLLGPIQVYSGNTIVRALCYSADAARFAALATHGQLELRDTATGAKIAGVRTGPDSYGVQLLGDGRVVTVHSTKPSVLELRSPDLQTVLWSVTCGTGYAFGFDVTPDERYVLVGSWDGNAYLWDLPERKLVRVLRVPNTGVASVALADDGKRALLGCNTGLVALWDSEADRLEVFRGHRRTVFTVAFSLDGRDVISGGWDQRVLRRRLSSKTHVWRHATGHESLVQDVAFSPDGTRAYSAGDVTLRTWNLATGAQVDTMGDSAQVAFEAVAIDPARGQALVLGLRDTLHAALTVGRWVGTLARDWEATDCVWSPDGRSLVASGVDGRLRWYDLGPASLTAAADAAPFDPSEPVPMNPRSLDAALSEIPAHTGKIKTIDVSPDGRLVASAGEDGRLRVWDVKSRRRVFDFERKGVRVVRFLPGEGPAKLVSSDASGHLRVWDLLSGEERQPPFPELSEATCLVGSPDGRLLLSGHFDGALVLWDVERREELDRLVLPLDAPRSLAMAPDASSVLVGTSRGVVLHIDVSR